MSEDPWTPKLAFAHRLRALRKWRKMTRPQLAEVSGLAASTIKGYEAAKGPSPRLETICMLAHGLGCHPAELLAKVPPLDHQASGLDDPSPG